MPYSEKKYYDLSTFAKTYNYGTILDDIEKYFGYHLKLFHNYFICRRL